VSDPHGSDRRTASRTPVSTGVVVRVKFKNRKQLESCFVKDISRNGIFLRTTTPRPVSEEISVVLELPNRDEVSLRGTVVHVITVEKATPDRPPGMGIQFSDLTDDKLGKLERYMMDTTGPMSGGVITASRPRPVLPPPQPSGMEELASALRRIVWICGDPALILAANYYQLLGLEMDVAPEAVRERVGVLRVLFDVQMPPEGVEVPDPSRIGQMLAALDHIEATLTEPERKADYDAHVVGVLR
jgi:uncharacterized protein (TIGR02266 family)